MNGQWIGPYSGSNSGNVILNVDSRPGRFQGVAYILDANPAMPSFAAWFHTEGRGSEFRFRTSLLLPVDPASGLPTDSAAVRNRFENVSAPTGAEVAGSWNGNQLAIAWTTDVGTTGSGTLTRTGANEPSRLIPTNLAWKEFREYVANLEGKRLLFRGQNKPWRLRTSFHRAGRADLTRFVAEDISELHKQLSARTKHVFNLSIPDETGAFYNLIQHHGYPTPLLDWTYSPFVAAFFAYRGITRDQASKAEDSEKVRILVFDQAQWKLDYDQVLQLLIAGAHLSIGEFMAIENERMIPQQAASTVTNIDDIEAYLLARETGERRYLSAIDLPVRDRGPAVQELDYMGITAGSLFPGLDGACEALRERNFPELQQADQASG